MEELKNEITQDMLARALTLPAIQKQFMVTLNLENKSYKLFYSYS